MVATLCLLGCVIAPAQPPERPPVVPPGAERLQGPRLVKGQEYVYRGSFAEESSGGRVQFSRSHRFEARVFVLDTDARGAEVALLTVLKSRDPKPGASPAPPISGDPVSGPVRLERARVDLRGRVTPEPGVSLAVPLEGPPAVESGAFFELPPAGRAPEDGWEVAEPGRPPRAWRVAGTERVDDVGYVKLEGVQQTDDWDRPRADRAAWRRKDTLWLAPRLGVAYRVERVIERRDPARRGPTQKSVLRYELESNLRYPGPMFEDRRQDIVQAHALAAALAPLQATPQRFGRELDALLTRIHDHLEHQPPTPYREAVVQVRRRAEAAKRGEVPPPPPRETPAAPDAPAVAAVGQPAPDFVAHDFTTRTSARLRKWQGHPVLLVFYNPASSTAAEVLRFAQRVCTSAGGGVVVLGMAVSEDAKLVLKQRAELGLDFPLLNGSGLGVSYALEATPKLYVIDADGVVRGAYLGWGRETAAEVQEELRQRLAKP
jgi:peroxiredoxin